MQTQSRQRARSGTGSSVRATRRQQNVELPSELRCRIRREAARRRMPLRAMYEQLLVMGLAELERQAG